MKQINNTFRFAIVLVFLMPSALQAEAQRLQITRFAEDQSGISSATFNFAISSNFIYVPASSVETYEQAPNWRNMANHIQTVK